MSTTDFAAALYGSPEPAPSAGDATLLAGGAAPAPAAAPTPTPAVAPAQMSMAVRLYGGEEPPTPEPVQESQETADQRAERIGDALYGEGDPLPDLAPQNLKAERAADADRKLYSPQGTFRHAIPDNVLDQEQSVADVPPQVRRAVVAEMREMAADLGMTPQDVSNLRSVANSIKQAPTDEQRVAWREEAVGALNREFGNDAAQVVRDAAKLAQRDPRVKQMLETRGLGDHPKIILQFARLARQARMQGRLK
ncbi:hypothetical protein [Cupriavidus metallidurans]|uniref:hypothetical protein n=1 Tax=Cupriavidus metallidurans TaxID=119219 RepID=UPI00076369A4|nr:hypothetical protein [Cupriavidus metallidurans]KWW37664.1 hypothetical protein AU374_01431 [Cupriavidus metallidurans]